MTKLAVRNVTKRFGGVAAVSECYFEVDSGTITGLIGPNGAGKSTTVDLITGFTECDSGEVFFGEERISGMAAHQIAGRGLVRTFQSTREWGSLTVLENLLVAAPSQGRHQLHRSLLPSRRGSHLEQLDLAEARGVLNGLGLQRMKNELAGNLSGGQKRLLDIGRILMRKPTFAVLDEPLAGVNPTLFPRLEQAIKDMRAEGITVLLIEHNLEFVEDVCQTSVVMALGSCIAHADMASLRADEAVVSAYLGSEAS